MEKKVYCVVVVKDGKIISDYKTLAKDELKAREMAAITLGLAMTGQVEKMEILIRPF